MTLRSLVVSSVASAVLTVCAYAGPIVVPPSPVPPPPGAPPSDVYRLAFVTTAVRDATSANIADYNAFVTGVANSVPELAALHTSWYVIGSTAAVDFAANAGFSFAPTYRLDGAWIASGLVNFYIGPLASTITIDEHGNSLAGVNVWTGNPSNPGHELGSADVVFGNSAVAWGLNEGTAANTNLYHLYAISGELHLTPEPGTIVLLATGLIALLGFARRRS